jgi:tetratricopeptide (TPR) repeat protein
MASKEVMVSAPLLLFFYDRCFVSGGFRAAWRERRGLYLALAGTWVILVLVMLLSANRGGTVGFGRGVSSWDYALTQCKALWIYLRLSFWPAPLVLDYGMQLVRDPLEVLPQALLILSLAAATILALWRRPVPGFFGLWFFAILAPSSSVVPLVTQTIAEHRMYLPLAALMVPLAWAVFLLPRKAALFVTVGLCAALASATIARNQVYRSAETIWKDSARKCPGNFRAHYTLVLICEKEGRFDEMISHYEDTLKAKPDHVASQFNLAFHLANSGRFQEALPHYREAVRLEPDSPDAHTGEGTTLMRLNRPGEAIPCFEAAARLKADSAPIQFNLGQALYLCGRNGEAIERYRKAIALNPNFPEAFNRIGNALASEGRFSPAVEAFREALRLAPSRSELKLNLGTALLFSGRAAEALPFLEQAVLSDPGNSRTQTLLKQATEEARR